MIIKEPEKKRTKKRRHLRKRKPALKDNEKAILSPVNLPVEKRIAPPAQETPSFWEKMFRFFVGEIESADAQKAFAPAMDPMRTILAIPDGIGRLEAFKEILQQTANESVYFRSIALSYRRHLMDMLEAARLPPATIQHHLEPCVQALKDAGLDADAQILTDLPPYEPYIPQQIFLNAAEKSELEAVDEQIAFSAKTAYRDFEIEMLRNNRVLALKHLNKAIQHAPGNPQYLSTLDNVTSKHLRPFTLRLENETGEHRVCSGQQFIWGRDENAALLHSDPQISREHAVFSYVGKNQWALIQREYSVPILFQNQKWEDGLLPDKGSLSLQQQTLDFEIIPNGLLIQNRAAPKVHLLLTPFEQVPMPWQPEEHTMPLNFLFHHDGGVYLIPTQHTYFNQEETKKKIFLLTDDVLSNPTQSWTVRPS